MESFGVQQEWLDQNSAQCAELAKIRLVGGVVLNAIYQKKHIYLDNDISGH